MNFLTKKLHLGKLCLACFLFLGINITLIAQTKDKVSTKVTIITKKIDKDGKEIVEKIVKEGDDFDQTEIDKMIEAAKKDAKEIDVSIEKESSTTIKTDGEGKTKNIWIEKDGKTIDLDDLEGENIMIFKTEDGKVIELGDDETQEIEIIVEEDGKKIIKKKKKMRKGDGAKMTKKMEIDIEEEGLHEEHITIKKEGGASMEKGEEMKVTVTVDEDGNTQIIKKKVKKEKGEDVEAKLEKMGIKLPVLGKPVANYVHAVTSNNWVFLAGKGPRKDDGKNIVGKLGKDLTVEQGYEAAKWAGINLLAALKGEIGDLNRVVRIVKVKGMVNAIPEFTDHSKVINGFSDLMVAVFGDKGKHARAAVGMSSLPGNMAVEIEVVVEIQ